MAVWKALLNLEEEGDISDESTLSEDEWEKSALKHKWSEDQLWGFFKINEIEDATENYDIAIISKNFKLDDTIKPIRKTWQELETMLVEDLEINNVSKFYVGAQNDRQQAWRVLKRLDARFSHEKSNHRPALYVAPITGRLQTCCCETKLLTLAKNKLIHQAHTESHCNATSGFVFLIDTGMRKSVPRLPRSYARMKYWLKMHPPDEKEPRSHKNQTTVGYEERMKWENDDTLKFEEVVEK